MWLDVSVSVIFNWGTLFSLYDGEHRDAFKVRYCTSERELLLLNSTVSLMCFAWGLSGLASIVIRFANKLSFNIVSCVQ
jgi:hypothetical protein